jgi:hypothetical protein
VIKKIIMLAIIMCCAASTASCDTEGALSSYFRNKDVIKVYVKDISNSSGQALITAEDFKAILEASLLKRKAMTFKMVSTAADSDIQISATIEKFQYLARGPLKPTVGFGTGLLDAAASATMNYAEMAVNFTVLSTKTGNVLWKDGVEGYLKKLMTAEESVPMISDKIARQFIWQCFGKANRKPFNGYARN